jgi:glycosyltransferase involved in cell wall biosynthesis
MSKLPVSLITTILNEASSIQGFIESVWAMSRKPDEIVIVDGGSGDGTVGIVQGYIKQGYPIRLFQLKGNRAQGRNRAIREADYDLIAASDAGCRVDRDWLTNIIEPLEEDETLDVCGGFYLPAPESSFEEAAGAVSLLSLKEIEPEKFLPSTRSVAFRRRAWEKVGGFPEEFSYNEDTPFALNLRRAGCIFQFRPEAKVFWRPNKTIRGLFRQFYRYATGDGEGLINPQSYSRLFAKYLIGLMLMGLGVISIYFPVIAVAGFFFYLGRELFKKRDRLKSVKSRLWFLLLRVVVDLANMAGYCRGLARRGGASGVQRLRK